MSSPAPSLVLLVEDDLRLAGLVRTYLQNNGFRVGVEHRGDRVVERVQAEDPDLLILDIGLPGQDGFAVCRQLRTQFSLPILILTARNNDIDHVVGLELGADDHVVKPVEPRVLVARMHALLRRTRGGAVADQRVLRFGSLSINPAARSVTLEGRQIALLSNEFDLLLFLASHPGETQSRETLYQQLYKPPSLRTKPLLSTATAGPSPWKTTVTSHRTERFRKSFQRSPTPFSGKPGRSIAFGSRTPGIHSFISSRSTKRSRSLLYESASVGAHWVCERTMS